VRSPLLNINRACQTCHHWPEEELRQRVQDIQDRTFAMRNQTMDVLVTLVGELKAARTGGATDAQLEQARLMQRRGQFLLDFIEAENSMGFHAGGEAARILAKSIDYLRQGQIALRDRRGAP
jgi:nitrite reductase (cytochrome c-552)